MQYWFVDSAAPPELPLAASLMNPLLSSPLSLVRLSFDPHGAFPLSDNWNHLQSQAGKVEESFPQGYFGRNSEISTHNNPVGCWREQKQQEAARHFNSLMQPRALHSQPTADSQALV